jgi:hypothetical protein
VPLPDGFSDFVHIERLLGNQNGVRAARNPAIHGNPAGIAAHYFHHDHAVVRLGRRVNAINCARRYVNRRIESEGEVRTRQIVVNGFRNTHHLGALLEKLLRYRKGVISTDCHQRIASVLLEHIKATLQAILPLRRVRARSP